MWTFAFVLQVSVINKWHFRKKSIFFFDSETIQQYNSEIQNYSLKSEQRALINKKENFMNSHKQQIFGTTVCWLTSDFKTCHIMRKPNFSFHKTVWGISKISRGWLRVVFLPAFSPFPLPHHFLCHSQFSFCVAESDLFINRKRKNTPKKNKNDKTIRTSWVVK